jgi:hypothetical protein
MAEPVESEARAALAVAVSMSAWLRALLPLLAVGFGVAHMWHTESMGAFAIVHARQVHSAFSSTTGGGGGGADAPPLLLFGASIFCWDMSTLAGSPRRGGGGSAGVAERMSRRKGVWW